MFGLMNFTNNQLQTKLNTIKMGKNKSFWMMTIGEHIVIFRNWENFGLAFTVSNANEDEHNILIHIWFLSFGLEIHFNSR